MKFYLFKKSSISLTSFFGSVKKKVHDFRHGLFKNG